MKTEMREIKIEIETHTETEREKKGVYPAEREQISSVRNQVRLRSRPVFERFTAVP
jgi:hypothetical protein